MLIFDMTFQIQIDVPRVAEHSEDGSSFTQHTRQVRAESSCSTNHSHIVVRAAQLFYLQVSCSICIWIWRNKLRQCHRLRRLTNVCTRLSYRQQDADGPRQGLQDDHVTDVEFDYNSVCRDFNMNMKMKTVHTTFP